MNTCPFRDLACGLSTPCAKCRAASSRVSYLFTRPASSVGRGGASSPSRYHTRVGGYWGNPLRQCSVHEGRYLFQSSPTL